MNLHGINKPALIKSLLVHCALVTAIAFNWQFAPQSFPVKSTPAYVKAVVVQKDKPQVENVKPKPKAKPKPKVPDELDFESMLELEAKKMAEHNKRQTDDSEATKQAQEKALARRKQIATEIDSTMLLMQQTMRRFWNRPPGTRPGMKVLLSIRLLPGGDVNAVAVKQSSGSVVFDRAAVTAVRKAGHFSVPEDPEIFNEYFREFSMLFNPEDLN